MTLFDTDPLKRTVEISLGELSQAEDRVYRILRPLLRDYELENASDLDIFVLSLSYPQGTFYMLQYEGRALSDSLPMLFPTTYISAREGLRMGAIADHFSMLKRLKKDYLLTDVMRIIEPRLISLELLSESGAPIIHGYVGLKEPVPLNAMGEGMGRAAGLVLAIASNGGGIVIIDEIENGLHYSVMSDVWKAIHKAAVEFDVQIFATTHSFEMIRAANEAFSDSAPDDFRYLRLDRSQSGQIKVVTYDEESLDSSLESNLEVR
jgi:hypothetical protein